MEEKRKDLKSTKQRKIIDAAVSELAKLHPDFYYSPAIELAAAVQDYVRSSDNLLHDDRQLVAELSRRDIQLILGLHSEQ